MLFFIMVFLLEFFSLLFTRCLSNITAFVTNRRPYLLAQWRHPPNNLSYVTKSQSFLSGSRSLQRCRSHSQLLSWSLSLGISEVFLVLLVWRRQGHHQDPAASCYHLRRECPTSHSSTRVWPFLLLLLTPLEFWSSRTDDPITTPPLPVEVCFYISSA